MRFKIQKIENYQIIPTKYLKDRKLSLKAKGLLTIMYSLPNNWDYTMNGLCKITNTGITAIRNTIFELEANGYLTRKEFKNEKGQFDYEYIVYTEKQKVKITENTLCLKKFKQKNRI